MKNKLPILIISMLCCAACFPVADEEESVSGADEANTIKYTLQELEGEKQKPFDKDALNALPFRVSTTIFTDIHSALNTEGYASEAANNAATYSESGHPAGTWRIPTKDEARALLNAHPDPSATVRYLCEDGTYTFTFAPVSSITKAGTKATYSLLLVTDI